MSSSVSCKLPREAFIHWIAQSDGEIKSTIALDSADQLARLSTVDDDEIGVFSAEKYFNGDVDSGLHNETPLQMKNIESGLIETEKVKVRINSPETENSDGSLPNHNAIESNGKPKETKITKFRTIVRAISKCSCAGGRSIEVNDTEASFQKRTSPAAYDGSIASFRLNDNLSFYPVGNWTNQEKIKVLYPPQRETLRFPNFNPNHEGRDDLEVFGAPFGQRKAKTIIPTWGAVSPKPQEESEISASSGICKNNDDDSDSSSDLIEIESLTGKVMLAKQDSTASGCVTPVTCYAPSESSIEWSVVTASAANMSVLSDQEAGTPSGSPLRTLSCSKNVRWRGWSSHRESEGIGRVEASTTASSRFMRSHEVAGSSSQSLARSRNVDDIRLLYDVGGRKR